jgi:hypothetical protein
MNLSVQDIQELFEILNKNNLLFIASNLGPNYLTPDELKTLKKFGVNPFDYYSPDQDTLMQSFYFGLLSDVLGTKEAKQLTFQDLKEYFEKGNYIPLTKVEQYTLDSIKKQSLSDIRSLQGRIFKDVNNIIDTESKKDRLAYEKIIRDEILSGRQQNKTAVQIASALGHKTGDWNRDFRRIVEYVNHQAFDEGRAALIERKNGDEAQVYKDVYDKACKHCVQLYLTGGIGSQPKIFKLSVLKQNGTNIGRKTAEWKPVIGSTHPYCRCTINEYDSRYIWNPKTGLFDILNPTYKEKQARKRQPIRISIKNKEYSV